MSTKTSMTSWQFIRDTKMTYGDCDCGRVADKSSRSHNNAADDGWWSHVVERPRALRSILPPWRQLHDSTVHTVRERLLGTADSVACSPADWTVAIMIISSMFANDPFKLDLSSGSTRLLWIRSSRLWLISQQVRLHCGEFVICKRRCNALLVQIILIFSTLRT